MWISHSLNKNITQQIEARYEFHHPPSWKIPPIPRSIRPHPAPSHETNRAPGIGCLLPPSRVQKRAEPKNAGLPAWADRPGPYPAICQLGQASKRTPVWLSMDIQNMAKYLIIPYLFQMSGKKNSIHVHEFDWFCMYMEKRLVWLYLIFFCWWKLLMRETEKYVHRNTMKFHEIASGRSNVPLENPHWN